MKIIFDYIKSFSFKNFFALIVTIALLRILLLKPELKDVLVVFLTLIIKHFFDSNTGAAAKDATISKALDQAQQTTTPTGVGKAENVTIDQSTKSDT